MRKVLDYARVLEKIKDSGFATEELIEEFFNKPFRVIVRVLPELWEEIRARVRAEVDWVLDNPKEFEDVVVSNRGRGYLEIDFDLERYLACVCDNVVQELKSGSGEK
jgi:hypothetical protein